MSIEFNLDTLAEDNIRILTLPAERLPKPVAIFLLGLPGSGKTTLVNDLSKSLPLAVISEEAMRHFLFPPKSTFLQHLQEETLKLAAKTSEKLVARGISCIYDSSLKKRSERGAIRTLIENAGGIFILIYLDLPPEEAFNRERKQNFDVTRGEKKGFIINRDLFQYEVASTELPAIGESVVKYSPTPEGNAPALKQEILRLVR